MTRQPPSSTLFPSTPLSGSQASKAMRYKRLSFRLRQLALAQGNFQHRQLSAALAELDSRVAALRGEADTRRASRSEEHTSELQSPDHLVCRLLLEKKKINVI